MNDHDLYEAFRQPRTLEPGQVVHTGPFGGFCPYYFIHHGRVTVASTFEQIIHHVPAQERVIDPTGCLELLQFNYLLGERTLVRGLRRMPWRASLHADGRIERQPAIPHGDRRLGPDRIAGQLHQLLHDELARKMRGFQRVRILLTGGLDSRITAGVLHEMRRALPCEIEAITWGHPRSRDVVYAQRIASWFGWRFHHLPYDLALARANIHRGANWGGSEVTGIHLHHMHWFADHHREGDLALAASWGDSIGRAEFSSIPLRNLTVPVPQNTADMIHPALLDQALHEAAADQATAWAGEPDERLTTRSELDQQENYMRRMIGQTMDYIRQFCPLEQSFTDPPLVSFMWSIDPACRTDDVYWSLLSRLDPRLYELPWARTGVAPSGARETDGSLRVCYHDWIDWISGPLNAELTDLFRSPGLRALGLLHGTVFQKTWVTQRLVKLASLELTRRRFGLLPCREASVKRDILADFVQRGCRKARRLLLPGAAAASSASPAQRKAA